MQVDRKDLSPLDEAAVALDIGSVGQKKRRILLINTGGTIGMVRTERGYAPKEGEILKALRGLQAEAGEQLPEVDCLEYSPLLDSTNVACEEWVRIAEDIALQEKAYDGFVILHGTDTMAYTASALSFMLQGLRKPVILTGSQIPLCQLRSDGRENLVTAILLAAHSQIPEVGLYFGGRLLRGNRATKVSADQLQAFDSPNAPVLAEAGVDLRLYPRRWLPKGEGLCLRPMRSQRIGVLKIFPGIQFSLFENLVEGGLNGLILEAFGAGNVPDGSGSLAQLLRNCAAHQIPTVVCTQCLQGRARLGEYAASAELCALGAINGMDLTVEAAVTKLNFLLSLGLSYDELCRRMVTPLCGEMSEAGEGGATATFQGEEEGEGLHNLC